MYRKITYLILLASTLQACATARSHQPTVRAQSQSGVVTSAQYHATEAGIEILNRGGHAVDAAIAVGFALAVTWPEAGNIGGGGFMLIRDKSRYAQVIDYRETAPAKSHPRMFLDAQGNIDPVRVRLGYVVAGIPGTVAGFAKAHELRGRLPWKVLLQPAIRLAREGFLIDSRIASALVRLESEMKAYPGSARVFYPNGTPLQEGQRLVQHDLAAVLEELAERGGRAFYEGALAERMATRMRELGGIWEADDLAAYQAKVRRPIRWTYKGHTLISVPPPSSGGIALGQMLGMLEFHELGALEAHGADYQHLLIEVMRRAFLERALFLGDSDFVRVDLVKLLSRPRLKTLARTIDIKRATDSQSLTPKGLLPPAPQSDSTTHFSVVDPNGNAVSNTYTIEESWGSKAVLDGFGFLLNNELHDFNVKPGDTNRRGRIGTPPNIIAPGKRPLSSQSPSMIEKGDQLIAVIGSPGGRTIINTVLQLFLNLTELKMDVLSAVKAPRIHHQWMPDRVFVEKGLPTTVRQQLEEKGHSVTVRKRHQGHANVIGWDAQNGQWVGVADPRYGGHAAGL